MSDSTSHDPRLPERVRIERVVPGGDGLARLADGRVVFVSGAFVGDLVELRALQVRGGYCRASEWSLLSESGERRTAPCPLQDRCGGCDWMTLQPEAQLRSKAQLVQDALLRVGKLARAPELVVQPSPQWLGYRNRVRLHLAPDGRLALMRQGSHELIPVERCLVCSERVNDAMARVARSVQAHAASAIAHAFEQLEIRCLAARDELLLFPRASRGRRKRSKSVSEWIDTLSQSFCVDTAERSRLDARLAQRVRLTAQEVPCELTIAPGVFTQINWPVNERIVTELVRGATQRGIRSFADLYCGVGNFSLPLLQRALDGTGIESHPLAVACARSSTDADSSRRFEQHDVARAVRRLEATNHRFDLVIVDPPRAGVGKSMATVAALSKRWIFYCACDPVSFARDARRLAELGFVLETLAAHDMFPQTHHVELTAWFVRPQSRDRVGA